MCLLCVSLHLFQILILTAPHWPVYYVVHWTHNFGILSNVWNNDSWHIEYVVSSVGPIEWSVYFGAANTVASLLISVTGTLYRTMESAVHTLF